MKTIREELKQFNSVMKEIDSLYGKLAHRSNLTDSSFWVLYYLTQMDEEITQKSICEQWFLSKQTVNNAIVDLQQKGHIVLVSSENDKRSKEIHLTKLGQEFTKKHIESIFSMEEAVFFQMSQDERNKLISGNVKFLQLMKEKLSQE